MGVKIGEQLKIIDKLEKLKSSSVEREVCSSSIISQTVSSESFKSDSSLFLPSQVHSINGEDNFAKTFDKLDLRNKKRFTRL